MRDLPEGWVETTLGEIAEINPRESLKKGTMAKCVAMEKLPTFDKRIAGFELKPFKGGTKFRNGDTLLARITPCLENGKTAYVDILDEGEVGFGSTEYIVIREKEGLSDKQFLFYLATSPRFREIAIKCMTGTSGRQRVQTDVLINKPLFFPPLPEQKAIADMLASFDEKIELLREQNKTLETLAQTIFKEWFVHFNFPDPHGKPYRNNGGEMVESELGLIPKGWRVGKLKEICDIKNGFAFKSKDYVNSGIPVVRTTNFTKGSVDLNSPVFLTEEKSREFKSYFLEKFDFLLVMVGASIGKNVITPSHILPALQNQNMWNFKPKDEDLRFYNIFLLRRLVFQQANSSSGSARDFFRKDYFYGLDIILPSNDVVSAFKNLIKSMFEKMDTNISQIQSLSKTRDMLLLKLMSGQVRVQNEKVRRVML